MYEHISIYLSIYLSQYSADTEYHLNADRDGWRERVSKGICSVSVSWRWLRWYPGDPGSIPGRVLPKTFKMVLDTSLLNSQQYKVRIKGKMEQSRERSSTLPYTSVPVMLKLWGMQSTPSLPSIPGRLKARSGSTW